MKVKVSRTNTWLALFLIGLSVAAYLTFPPLQQALGEVARILTVSDPEQAIRSFRDYLLGFGLWAPLVSALLMIFQAVIAPLPSFIVTFTNGLLFGWGWGALLSWTSAMIGAALCFWIARSLGRPAVEKLVGGTKALEVSDLFFARYGNRAVLVSRLLPFVSFDIISYGAGLTPTTFRSFMIATGIGQLPATLLYSYLGQNATGSVKVLFWVFSVTTAILVVAFTLRPFFIRRLRKSAASQAGLVETEKAV